MCFSSTVRDDCDTYAIGQINKVTLKNLFAEDQTMKSLTRQRGEVPSITESQDTHTAVMMISAVFREDAGNFAQGIFGTVPPTNTAIRIIDQGILNRLVERHASHIVRVGKVFGSDVLLPSWFRHFGSVDDGGFGDAMHIGIFGKTGSGKSVLGKMIMLSYMRHKAMSLLVLDPQGEFSKIDESEKVRHFVSSLGKTIRVYDLSKLILPSDWEIFRKILIDSRFIRRLGIRADENQNDAAYQITRILATRPGTLNDDMGEVPLDRTHERAAFDRVWLRLQCEDILTHIYTSPQARARVTNTIRSSNPDEFYADWEKIARLFGPEGGGRKKIADLLENIGNEKGSVTIINLSETSAPGDIFWSDGVQKVVINQMLSKLVAAAQAKFTEKRESLNTLVVLDEAHRLAPRRIADGGDDGIILKNTLLDAIRTTRKFGLGWMFISQTLASLDRELLQQMRMYFFGYGLAWGTELDALKNLIGGKQFCIGTLPTVPRSGKQSWGRKILVHERGTVIAALVLRQAAVLQRAAVSRRVRLK